MLGTGREEADGNLVKGKHEIGEVEAPWWADIQLVEESKGYHTRKQEVHKMANRSNQMARSLARSRRRHHRPRRRVTRDFLEIVQRPEPHRTQPVEIAVAVHLSQSKSANQLIKQLPVSTQPGKKDPLT